MEKTRKVVLNTKNIKEPDITQISEGQIFKSYKDMCQQLDLPVTTSTNSRDAQRKNIERYLELENIPSSNQIKVKSIYPVPLPKDYREDSTYLKYIEFLLIKKLAASGADACRATKRSLYTWLYMVDDQYASLIKDKRHTDFSWGISKNPKKQQKSEEEIIEDIFYQNSLRQLDRVLTSALRSMCNRKLIYCHEEKVINKKVEDNKANEFWVATEEEERKILKAEREALLRMGFNNIQGIFASGRQSEYYDAVNYIVNRDYGWNFVYSQLKIIFTPNTIFRESLKVDKPLEELYKEIADAGAKLNNTLVEVMSASDFFKRLDKSTNNPFDEATKIKLYKLVEERIKLPKIAPNKVLVGSTFKNKEDCNGELQ